MKQQYVKMTKLSATDNPFVPTPGVEEYVPGIDNPGVSLPVEYTATGWVNHDIETGSPVMMYRDSRNGNNVQGYMRTSIVESIEPFDGGLVIRTMNSVYKLEWLDENTAPMLH